MNRAERLSRASRFMSGVRRSAEAAPRPPLQAGTP
jgi:hypothetical protein